MGAEAFAGRELLDIDDRVRYSVCVLTVQTLDRRLVGAVIATVDPLIGQPGCDRPGEVKIG